MTEIGNSELLKLLPAKKKTEKCLKVRIPKFEVIIKQFTSISFYRIGEPIFEMNFGLFTGTATKIKRTG